MPRNDEFPGRPSVIDQDTHTYVYREMYMHPFINVFISPSLPVFFIQYIPSADAVGLLRKLKPPPQTQQQQPPQHEHNSASPAASVARHRHAGGEQSSRADQQQRQLLPAEGRRIANDGRGRVGDSSGNSSNTLAGCDLSGERRINISDHFGVRKLQFPHQVDGAGKCGMVCVWGVS